MGHDDIPLLREKDVFDYEQRDAAYEGCKYRGKCNHHYESACDSKCATCGETVPRHTLELDHILAIGVAERLGEFFYHRAFTPDNLWWICQRCHRAKTAYDRMCMRVLDNPVAEEEEPLRPSEGIQAPMLFEEDRPENFLPRLGETMKAITLHQPWASLIAEGVKTIETRDWPAPEQLVGKRIAIHAAKREPAGLVRRSDGHALAYDLTLYGPLGHLVIGTGRKIPTGAVLATARLSGVARVLECDGDTARVKSDEGILLAKTDPYGDFSVGRWLWMLEDVHKLCEPIPARGRQGFWDWDWQGGKAK